MTDQPTKDLAAIRRALRFDQWDKIGEVIAKSRRQPLQGDPAWLALLPKLREESIVALPLAPSGWGAERARDWFATQPTHPGAHVFNHDAGFRGYRAEAVLRCPGLLDLFNHAPLTGLIEAYLECIPTLHSVNAWWSDPSPEPHGEYQQFFHRDTDDFRFLTLFVQLTDVDEESGPHQIQPGTHLGDPSELEPEIFTATGPAGTMWLANTMALHRGLVPSKRSRLMVWARYGLGPNSNSLDLEQGPLARCVVPTDMTGTARERYINRLLIDWEKGPI